MARRSRLDEPGAIHHVTARGIERGALFVDDYDRRSFLVSMERALRDSGARVLAWSLMTNHFHLLLQTGELPLSRIMQRLLTRHAMRFNRRHDRCGHLFQNRFGSERVASERHLYAAVAYVHLNPLEAKLVPTMSALAHYAWTGHAVLMDNRPNRFQDADAVLGLFDGDPARAREALESFMAEFMEAGATSPPRAEPGLHLSQRAQFESTKFGLRALQARSRYIDRTVRRMGSRDARRAALRRAGWTVGRIVRLVCSRAGAQVVDVERGRRLPRACTARAVIAHLACEILGATQSDVARHVGVGQPAIVKCIERGRRAAPQVIGDVDELFWGRRKRPKKRRGGRSATGSDEVRNVPRLGRRKAEGDKGRPRSRVSGGKRPGRRAELRRTIHMRVGHLAAASPRVPRDRGEQRVGVSADECDGAILGGPVATILIPESLRRHCGGESRVEVRGAAVRDVLDDLFRTRPELRVRVVDAGGSVFPHLHLYRNGDELPRDGLLARPVAQDDTLELVAAAGDPGHDVRMRGFQRRVSFETALAEALDGLPVLPAETVPLGAAAGRVLAEAVSSDVDVPAFRRAAMDGYAVRAEDTFGASLYDPVRLALVGESMPGGDGGPRLGRRECAGIMTGAPLPAGADAVLPAEQARRTANDVFAESDVTPWKNVGVIGEDVTRGTRLLEPGRTLRPQDLGLLASIGRDAVAVARRPRVRIVVTGNELLPPGERPAGHCIADSNTPMLRALVERDGGVLESAHRLPDDEASIRAVLSAPGADVIVSAGGTSVGREDHMPQLVRELGELAVHGVAMRPAAPAGVGRIGGAKTFLLPGNPVSCLAAYDLLVSPAIRRLAGLRHPAYAVTRHRLRRRIVSQVGRTDYVRIALTGGDAEPIAIAGASVLSSTTRADGFVLVPAESEGLAEGAEVTVFRYDVPPGSGGW